MTEQTDDAHRVIGPPVLVHCRKHAKRHTKPCTNDDSECRELNRRWHDMQNILNDGLAGTD
ncbi:hypothetical protein D3C80_2130160 [compost metagenome]